MKRNLKKEKIDKIGPLNFRQNTDLLIYPLGASNLKISFYKFRGDKKYINYEQIFIKI